MTRAHYVLIARAMAEALLATRDEADAVLRYARRGAVRDAIVRLADAFERDELARGRVGRFDRARFLGACEGRGT